MKSEIQEWLDGDRNFEEGVKLYQEYGGSPLLKRRLLIRRGPAWQKRLEYELEKIVKLTAPNFVPKKDIRLEPFDEALLKATNPEEFRKVYLNGQRHPEDKGKYQIHFKDLPDMLQKLVIYKGQLFNKRAKLHSEMVRMPDENIQELVTRRGEIRELVVEHSRTIETIYKAIRHYETTKELPAADIIPIEKPENENSENKDKNPEKQDTTPEKQNEISDVDLVKQYKNLQSSRRKDYIKVYGDPKKKKDPLPEGPKKESAKQRLEEKDAKLAEMKDELIKKGLMKG
ncbi:hypothetical protein DF185_19890 [Marinifilum breve]|uniref:Uncharacterized protein n=1 Tax=Marinifilum breve TaxID=2184082 RepID=A0A2V3ZST8_9BACT|nr:hypothetical protein [Marinifilum breve]PXX96904.1 hypothetical protein DF185_19890 [Marinifilum breve]